jgi:DNA-binding NtrC family response regulator
MADAPRILIVDDERSICLNCVKILSKRDYDVHYVLDGQQALRQMAAQPFDVVITDLKMRRMGGMEVLARIQDAYPQTRVIVITGYASVASAVEVMKTGAFDYLAKPFTPHELRSVVAQALADIEQDQITQQPPMPAPDAKAVTHQLIGSSAKIRQVVAMIQKVAPTNATVMINGESGTGKELVARAIHANSNRRETVFFAVDCGTLSDNLLESELFGYKRGAFTGADRDKEGILTRANGGTIFLDEISNTSLEVQGKLLRFIENREFLPLGATHPQQVDVRLIFATNENLTDLVQAGTFREDFYYRIFVYPIAMPPLRQRREDILPIADHFLRLFARKMQKKIAAFDDAASRRLNNYDWPGNVRQLRNVVERAVILCDQQLVSPTEIQLDDKTGAIHGSLEHPPQTNAELKEIKKVLRQQAVAEVERKFLMQALINADWNITQAARDTGMQRSNFQALMKKHNIRRPPEKNGR